MHLSFIMDGNRRWATGKNVLKMLGHSQGADNIENVLKMCIDEKVEYVSMWVLAKKNLEERSKAELDHIFDLVKKKIPDMIPKLNDNSIRFETIGDMNLLPLEIQNILKKAEDETQANSKMTFVFAIGYGGQDEIVRGIKKYISANSEKLTSGKIDEVLKGLDEKEFSAYLETGKYPPPDLIVRTGGDIRTSGFFLYQSEYSDFHFTSALWPDFDLIEFKKALDGLKSAKKNFGK